jgi:hemerythrin-like metal-binding protein
LARERNNEMLVEWTELYSTGIDEIDGHHKKLLELLNKSYFMILEESSQDELMELLEELIDYAKYHFATEEELMRSHDYDKIDGHLREHFRFTNKVLSFEIEARVGKKYLLVDVFDFVRNWLLNHILTVDLEMAKAIRSR